MSNEDSERELRQFFQEMRRDDAAGAPAFGRVLHPARPRPRLTLAWGRFAAAALLLVAVGLLPVVYGRYKARQSADSLGHWACLANWEAPTDALLSNPDAVDPAAPNNQWIPGDSSESREILCKGRKVS